MNFLIDAESKLPSSNDPNPKGGNDPEKARESPPGRIRLFAAPTLFFFLLLLFSFSFFLFSFFSSFSLFSLFFLPFLFFLFFVFVFFLFSIANGDPLFEFRFLFVCARPMETGPLSLRSRVPTSPGERSTCNLLYSIFRPRFLPTIRVFKCVFRAVR